MKFYCPECETRYEGDDFDLCPEDGARLFRLDAPDDDGDPLIDTLVDERFRIQQLVGTGGMGAVYRALQLSVQREVAIKVLRPELVDREVMLERFFREAKVVSELSHPNIVRLVDFGQDEELDLLYLVMEMVEGTDLGELLERGRLEPNLALEIVYQICGALTEPHNRGIVHRDLKPENLIMMPISDGTLQVKVLDFGIARALESGTQLTKTGMICGTPAYMSPEQAQDEDLDGRSDLYALGVMLYEMLTGQPPFSGESSLQVLLKHVREPVPDLTAVTQKGALPDEISRLVGNLMDKDPDQRPDSARQVRDRIDELRHHLDLRPVRLEADTDDERAFDAWISPRLAVADSDDREADAEVSSDELARTLAASETGEVAEEGPNTGQINAESSDTEREYAGVADTLASAEVDAASESDAKAGSEPTSGVPDDGPDDGPDGGLGAVDRQPEPRPDPSPTDQSDAIEPRDKSPLPEPEFDSGTSIGDIVTHPAVIVLSGAMFLIIMALVGVAGYLVFVDDFGDIPLVDGDPPATAQPTDQTGDPAESRPVFDEAVAHTGDAHRQAVDAISDPGDDAGDEAGDGPADEVDDTDEPATEPTASATEDDDPAQPREPADDEPAADEPADEEPTDEDEPVDDEPTDDEPVDEDDADDGESDYELPDTAPPEQLGGEAPADDEPADETAADEPTAAPSPADEERAPADDEDQEQQEDEDDELRDRLDRLRGD